MRFVRDKKYGFANRKGEIVVPPIYDGAMNFENGIARAVGTSARKLNVNITFLMEDNGLPSIRRAIW